MAVLPEEIPTGLVTAQYYFVNEDNIDADTDPELTVVTGTVRFIASVKVLRMPSKKAVLVPLSFDAVFDSQGNLTPVNGTGIGIELPATDSPLFSEQDYTWGVEFNLREVGNLNTVNLPPFDIQVPVGSTQDLSVLMPVDSSPGTITIQGGPEGPEGPVGPTPSITIGTVTTTTPNPVIGPIGPIGPKGDPGGWVPGPLLDQTDLDAVRTAGMYRQNNTTVATLARHYPVANTAGFLNVYAFDANTGIQEFIPHSGTGTLGVFYRRRLISGIFDGWKAYTSTRTDQTAGRAIYQWDELNNREQLIYGDTGWRDISSLFSTYKDGIVRVRREMHTITVLTEGLNFTDEAPGMSYSFDLGAFALSELGIEMAIGGYQNGTKHRFTAGWNGIHKITLGSSQPFDVSGIAKFDVRGNWPTTLPGSASGTIPNL